MDSPGHSVKVGEEYLGCVIAEILGQSSRVLVYTTTDNQLRWAYLQDTGVVPQELEPAISEFDPLMTSIKTYVPDRHQKIAYVNLGKSLFVALDRGQPTKIADGEVCPTACDAVHNAAKKTAINKPVVFTLWIPIFRKSPCIMSG